MIHHHHHKHKQHNMILKPRSLPPWLFSTSIFFFFIFFFFLIFSPTSSSRRSSLKEIKQGFAGGWDWKQGCDLSDGRWVRDEERKDGKGYTNRTCKLLPESKNCGKYGKNGDYERWRWRPERCSLPWFNATEFFRISKGMKLAFVGDSVARNQADSLLCLLSQIEIPKPLHSDPEDKSPIWHFESHSFTLMVMWTQFLVQGTERIIDGSASGVYDLQLDKIDRGWTEKLPFTDYIIISSGHWFFRKIYLHENDQLIGCIYCSDKNITSVSPTFGLQKAFRRALQFIGEDDESDRYIFTFLRTFSPAHFENGTWNGGGYCNRTKPFDEGEVKLTGTYWDIRRAQADEINRIKAENKGLKRKKFELLDITKAMLMRPDAHPDTNWDNQWMRGHSDCVHWCMPGAVDMWNDMLLLLLTKYLMEIQIK